MINKMKLVLRLVKDNKPSSTISYTVDECNGILSESPSQYFMFGLVASLSSKSVPK